MPLMFLLAGVSERYALQKHSDKDWFKARTHKCLCWLYDAQQFFGIYVVHYLVIASLGYTMKVYTQLPPVLMYLILTVAVFTLSPLLYEIIKRIPLIRWCVLGD